jgi:primosomal protein N' (replication factor Y) (superfamily II helicase)
LLKIVSQAELFQFEDQPWETDDQRDRMVATVVLVEGPPEPYSYEVPEALRTELQLGQRIRVPFGQGDRQMIGYCVELGPQPNLQRKLKMINAIVDPVPLISASMLRLTRWMSDYYMCAWAETLQTVLPAAVRSQQALRELTMVTLQPHWQSLLHRGKPVRITPKQQTIIDYLVQHPVTISLADLASHCQVSPAPIHSLAEKQIVRLHKEFVGEGVGVEHSEPRDQPWQLNADQQRALDEIRTAQTRGEHRTILLHGVTGSGKTEVYMQAIAETLSFRRQAIILVPEISLTPQTRERFHARFGKVAVLHSHLRDAERLWHWERIARGEVDVVIGARSAIFAPCPRLGLVILDEEHEGTFKQDKAPRYHAREVARQRTENEGVPLILGSATPSLESWQLVIKEQATLCDLPTRVSNRPLPHVSMIDLRDEMHNRTSRGAISRQLHQAIQATLREQGQVILLLNRRGFSTHIQCPGCGTVVKCPNCDLALTHHRTNELAVCHYCDYTTRAPTQCAECQFSGLRYSGLGTQRLEQEVQARFPESRVLRMDTDTMKQPGSYAQAFTAFRNHEVDLLVGTQMIAKGLDFPNVLLVGVINADTALHLPDYRAAERTFQLVTQVAGRTGRGERGGRVLVQTFNPEHPALMAAAKHDYFMFADNELPQRKVFQYPPYWALARIIIRGPTETAVQTTAQGMSERIKAEFAKVSPQSRVLGPAPAPITKIRNLYRYHLQIQAPTQDEIRAVLKAALHKFPTIEQVQWMIDIDPLDML